MSIDKEAFYAYLMGDENFKLEFKRLVDFFIAEGKSQLEAVREVRKSMSYYFSYKANEEERKQYSDTRRKRCYNAVIENSVEAEQFIATVYGLSASETVTYARSYYHEYGVKPRGVKWDFEVVGKRYVASSKKRQNDIPENETTYVNISKNICYSTFKQIKAYLKRCKIPDEYFKKMVAYLKEHRVEVYENLMMNIRVAEMITTDDQDLRAEGLELVDSIKNKIINNPGYTILDYYKDTKGLSISRFNSLYMSYYNKTNDKDYNKVVWFMKGHEEVDNVHSPVKITRIIKGTNGEEIVKEANEEQTRCVYDYINRMGLPCSIVIYSTGLDMILDRPEFFESKDPKRA